MEPEVGIGCMRATVVVGLARTQTAPSPSPGRTDRVSAKWSRSMSGTLS